MPRDFSMDSVGGMLDGLKSRLGFNRNDDYDQGDYDDYDDYGYDEYDDFDDAGVDAGDYRQAQAGPARTSRFGRADSSPNLVSFDDVKASTTVPDRLRRDPLAPADDGLAQTRVGGHYVIDTTAPAPDSPAYRAAQRDLESRVNLPAPTLAVPETSASSSYAGTSSSRAGQVAGTYDPYVAYSSSNPSAHAPSRTLTVVKPTSYGDVERVARAVKSGDVVVLAMRNTPDDLSKRILDFSFGVASALDANVECPGSKVFAIARGSALTEDEKRRLRAQAVL